MTSMDILRLPVPLRRLILAQKGFLTQGYRHVSTTSSGPISPVDQPPLPQPLLLTSSILNSYIYTPPPTIPELHAARAYFTRHAPSLLFSSSTFRDLPISSHPEVAFLGRSNVGKSSLLNALFNRTRRQPPAHVSKRAGRTRTINGFGLDGDGNRSSSSHLSPRASSPLSPNSPPKPPLIRPLGRGSLVVVDMPGYGGGSRAEWGAEALKFLRNRTQLRRTFVLVDAEHGAKRSDVALLAHLRGAGVAVQVLLSKVDKILYPTAKVPGEAELRTRLERLEKVVESVREEVEGATGEKGWLGDILCFSAEKSLEFKGSRGKAKIGIDEVRWAAITAAGLEVV